MDSLIKDYYGIIRLNGHDPKDFEIEKAPGEYDMLCKLKVRNKKAERVYKVYEGYNDGFRFERDLQWGIFGELPK